ncbi:MAG: hypothetical protein HXY48_08800 [Ignavibacteriaceae bacterium]|nr:hypothetical protein [Ignavibacteriaceae bacterium]
MSNIIYSITNDFFPAIKSHNYKGIVEKSAALNQNIQSGEKLSFTFLRGLKGETKLILGVIYFFSLLFFTIMLFT